MIFVLQVSMLFVYPSRPEVLKKKFYKQGTEMKTLLYESRAVTEMVGPQKVQRQVYKDVRGKIAIKEEVLWRNGKFSKLVIEQKQIGETWIIERIGKKILFLKIKKNGEEIKELEDYEENFVVAQTLKQFFRKNWGKILSGDTIHARFGVPERQETVGFKYFKVSEETIRGHKVIVVKMKPSSFIIAAIVDPLYFYLKKDGTGVLKMTGRTILKVKNGNDWETLDADIAFFRTESVENQSKQKLGEK